MRSNIWIYVIILVAMAFILSACSQLSAIPSPTLSPTKVITPNSPPTEAPEPTLMAEEPIYLAIIWHQHQPVYYKDPETSIYEKPWVRVHAAKDYVDMAAKVKKQPDIHFTFNIITRHR